MGKVKILKASAGSGKTYRLAYEYIKGVIEDPQWYRGTLAVTFTNKATEQMKRRIIAALHALAQGDSPYLPDLIEECRLPREQIISRAARARTLILHDYSRFSVSTIDKFFQRIARSFFRELGLDFDYAIEIERDRILSAAVDRLLDQTAADPELHRVIAGLLDERTEQGLGWNLRPDIMYIGSELFKESYRPNPYTSEELLHSWQQIEEQTRERFALLKELCRRATALIAAADLSPEDFKQGRNSFACYLARLAESDEPLAYNSYFQKSVGSAEEWCSKTTPHRERILELEPELMPLLQQIAPEADAILKDSRTRKMIAENLGRSLLLARLAENIRAVAAEENVVMIHETTGLIHRLVSGTDAPFIYEKVGNTYTRYMIDEFQDTSEQQWSNFLPLLENALSESEREAVMLIGDVKQSIYRWRGGNWRILGMEAEARFTGQLADPVPMDTNWRSERTVIRFNNSLIRQVVAEDTCALTEMLEGAPEDMQPMAGMVAHSYEDFEQKASPRRESQPAEGYVEVRPCLREEVPGRLVAYVEDILSRGYMLREIAVLVRTNGEARYAADILLGAGYAIVSQEALLLGSSPVVQFVMNVYRLAQLRDDEICRAEYGRFLGREYGAPLPDEEAAFLDGLLRTSLPEAFEQIVSRYRLNARPEAVSFLQSLYQVVLSYNRHSVTDVPSLLEWWEQNAHKRTVYLPSEQDAVTVMTVHKAKGLEFPCVLIPFCDWDLLPRSGGTTLWSQADNPESPFARLGPVPLTWKKELEHSHYRRDYYRECVYSHVDNINLLYVALTRAGRELYVMYDKTVGKRQRVSRLIEAVLPHCSELIPCEEADGSKIWYCGRREEAPVRLPDEEGEERQIVLDHFPSHDSRQRVRVRWVSDRYFGQDRQAVSPRRFGVIFHRLLEWTDILGGTENALERMIAAGEIEAGGEAERIRSTVLSLLSHPVAGEWFGGEWKVHREQDILASGAMPPDRMMTRGDEAAVVGYRFGTLRRDDPADEVRAYMQLMRRMGYREVTGWLWYVELGEVEPVIA